MVLFFRKLFTLETAMTHRSGYIMMEYALVVAAVLFVIGATLSSGTIQTSLKTLFTNSASTIETLATNMQSWQPGN